MSSTTNTSYIEYKINGGASMVSVGSELSNLEWDVIGSIPLASTYSDFSSNVDIDVLLKMLSFWGITRSKLSVVLAKLSSSKYVELITSGKGIDAVTLGVKSRTWLMANNFVDSTGKLTTNNVQVPEDLRPSFGNRINSDGYFYTMEFKSQEWYDECLELDKVLKEKAAITIDYDRDEACCICSVDCSKVGGFQYNSTLRNKQISVCHSCFEVGVNEYSYDLDEMLGTLEMSKEEYLSVSSKFANMKTEE